MSKKIVILGALGYLGTELCKQYSGESWFSKIVAIDSRFVSERVSQLKDWNIEFHQGQILDEDFLKRDLNDADLVHHLAGVTDVSYVKKESNVGHDEKIQRIAVDGTNNILKIISDKCKIIFPSTLIRKFVPFSLNIANSLCSSMSIIIWLGEIFLIKTLLIQLNFSKEFLILNASYSIIFLFSYNSELTMFFIKFRFDFNLPFKVIFLISKKLL